MASFKEYIKIRIVLHYIKTSFKWMAFSVATGIVCGVLGTLLYFCVSWGNATRQAHEWVLFLLPIGGLLIVKFYHMFKIKEDKGVDLVFDSVRNFQDIPFRIIIVSFVSTVLTHTFGGSSGRVGVALQMGGSVASNLGKLFRLNSKDRSLFAMCGMAGLISALFGTPLMATFLSMEVISVGVIYYAALLPCLLTAVVAFFVSKILLVEPLRFTVETIPALDAKSVTKVAALSIVCAVVSILFCCGIKFCGDFFKKFFSNQYLRIVTGSFAIIGLTLLVGNQTYNGASSGILAGVFVQGEAKTLDFLLKMTFTVVTLACGYKGGAVYPAFVIGSSFGCIMAPIVGLPVQFAAAVGLIAVFCGVVNCPIASLFLSVELFGGDGIMLFAIACAISFVFSGYFTIFPGQQFVYSKLRMEYKKSGLREDENL